MRPMPPEARVPEIEYVQYRKVVQRDICSYCGGPGGTKDHITPKPPNDGPINLAENLTGACINCNSDKGALDLLGFLWIRSLRREAEAALLR